MSVATGFTLSDSDLTMGRGCVRLNEFGLALIAVPCVDGIVFR